MHREAAVTSVSAVTGIACIQSHKIRLKKWLFFSPAIGWSSTTHVHIFTALWLPLQLQWDMPERPRVFLCVIFFYIFSFLWKKQQYLKLPPVIALWGRGIQLWKRKFEVIEEPMGISDDKCICQRYFEVAYSRQPTDQSSEIFRWVFTEIFRAHELEPAPCFNLDVSPQVNSVLECSFLLLKGPYDDVWIKPVIHHHSFSNDTNETDYVPLPISDSVECNKLLAAKNINLRLFIFQVQK